MLRLMAAQAQMLWDAAWPTEVRELPADLAALDPSLSDPGVMAPSMAHWQRGALASGVTATDRFGEQGAAAFQDRFSGATRLLGEDDAARER
ncbi:MAG TPA: hypothetical protein VF526_08120 [Solirubrobacteraceae bacterium]|jgi:hypothetical protein